jgi:hypothetical protein
VKIYNERIKASNVMSTNGKKEPIVKDDAGNVVGVELLIDTQNKIIQFFYITSSAKGYGEKIVSSVIKATPDEWSHGFWPVMANKSPKLILA